MSKICVGNFGRTLSTIPGDYDTVSVDGIYINTGFIDRLRQDRDSWHGPFWFKLRPEIETIGITTIDPSNQQEEQVFD